jgi:hypothetical protein
MVYTGFRSTVLQFLCIKIYKVTHLANIIISEESYRNVFKTGFIIIHVYLILSSFCHHIIIINLSPVLFSKKKNEKKFIL